MKAARFLILVLALLVLAVMPGAAAPLAGSCAPGAAYDPACDANQDGQITVTDIQLTAGYWNQTGTWLSDNDHNHLGQTGMGTNSPLKLTGSFGDPDYAPLVLSNSATNGLRVSSAGWHGVSVNEAGADGIYVFSAGSPSSNWSSSGSNGLEIASAEDYGLFVGWTGGHGVFVTEAGGGGPTLGVALEAADKDALVWVFVNPQ